MVVVRVLIMVRILAARRNNLDMCGSVAVRVDLVVKNIFCTNFELVELTLRLKIVIQ